MEWEGRENSQRKVAKVREVVITSLKKDWGVVVGGSLIWVLERCGYVLYAHKAIAVRRSKVWF